MSLEAWKAFFEIGGIALLAATFIFGAGAYLVNDRLNKIQSQELASFRLRFEEEQQKTAHAQQEAAEAKALAGGFERDIAVANQKSGEANERAASLEIEAANQRERAAKLELEALTLRQQMLVQGPRENLLKGQNRQEFVNMLKPFAGQKIDVRHSSFTLMVNSHVVSSSPIGDDALGLSQSLIDALKDAGWLSPATPLLSGFQGQGMKVEIVQAASPETRAAAIALVDALRKVTLEVDGPLLDNEEQAKRVGDEVISPPLDGNTIILNVFSHP
jgi:hypothetical protein